MLQGPSRYPKTPHWPWSETVHRDDSYHQDPEFFLDKEVVVTEKIDGGNTALYRGEVYARSTLRPSHDGWMAMVRKNHAWKVDRDTEWLTLFGEDIAARHSISYTIPMDETFYLFAARISVEQVDDIFCSWDGVESYAKHYDLPTVPVIFKGSFSKIKDITEFFIEERKKHSAFGPEKEGFVMRTADSFPANDFSQNVAKFVRAKHVQTDEHWTRNWQWNILTSPTSQQD